MIQGLGDPDSPGLKPFEVRLVLSLELRIKGSSAVVGPRWALQIRAALLGQAEKGRLGFQEQLPIAPASLCLPCSWGKEAETPPGSHLRPLSGMFPPPLYLTLPTGLPLESSHCR